MIIAGHNRKLLNKYYEETNRQAIVARTCNCRAPVNCPLDGNCLQNDVLYKGRCQADGVPVKNYIGLTATTFKVRFANHKTSFNTRKYSQETTLSSYFWKMKDEGRNPAIKFSVIRTVKSYTPEMGKCALCVAEKLEILNTDPSTITNSRNELMSSCRHKTSFLLENYKSRKK